MKRTFAVLPLLMFAAPLASFASDQLIPAGSIISCVVSEGKISSKTTAIGDPVLCTLNPVEKYGRTLFPYGSYIEGRFEDYKDPGHFVGKGYMELKFDKMFIGNRVVPISAKVVQTPKYKVDENGRILGNGHAVKDTVEWLIPVLWPIDLINLPRRGPRPVLAPESKLTLELMEDLGIPNVDEYRQEQYPRQERAALIERQEPQAPIQQAYAPQQAPAQPVPQQVIYQTFQQTPPVQQQPQVVYQPVYQQAPQQQTVVVQTAPQAPAVVYHHYPPPPVYYRYPAPYGYGYPY